MHLWEVKHSYYCSDNNYFARPSEDYFEQYYSWKDFLKEEGNLDYDLNLIFRWDWEEQEEDDDGNLLIPGRDCLKIFYMHQRKGLFRAVHIFLIKEDEADVIKFLEPRLQHLMKLWEPFHPNQNHET